MNTFESASSIDEAGNGLHERGNMVARGSAGISEIITLFVVHARAHLHDVADGDTLIATASQFGQVIRYRYIQGRDQPVFERTAYEHGGDGFGHGPADEAGIR